MHIPTSQGVREAIVLPSRQGPAPTVIVLHGALGTAERTARTSGFAEAAAAHRFTAVFPQGLKRQWNDGREPQAAGVDDVGFIHELVGALVGRGISDRAHVYIAGISNGGMMTFRMLCEASEVFAGAATIIANMPSRVGARCLLRKPVPVVMFNGTADPLVPYEGGGVGFAGGRGQVWAAEETAEFMADASACEEARVRPLPVSSRSEMVRVTRLEWTRCRSGGRVALYRFEGGGHQVPGRRQRLSLFLGPGYQGLRAADEAFAFFYRR
jgi:polyhydroxybutyrate depolymerase